VRGWESYLDNHLNPLIGDMVLRHINNAMLKMLGENLSAAGLSATTIHDVAKVMRWVKASAVELDSVSNCRRLKRSKLFRMLQTFQDFKTELAASI
jgi:hypothetical protein